MLSKSLTFLLYGLALLLAVICSFACEAVAQSEGAQLISLPVVGFAPNAFVVYGRAPTQAKAGIVDTVLYRQTTETLPDLEEFFAVGATLELLTPTLSLNKHDIVISEIMWGVDFSYPDTGEDTYTQWIELYNTQASQHIKTQLFFRFTPLRNYPDRDVVELPNGKRARVLDAISTLHLDKWDLPGESGGRPSVEVVSAYRNIVYSDREYPVPFGSYEVSWKATPKGGPPKYTPQDLWTSRGKTSISRDTRQSARAEPILCLYASFETRGAFRHSCYQRGTQRCLTR